MHSSRTHGRRAGLTLLEIVTVVAIVGVFAVMAVPSFNRYRENQELRAVVRDGSAFFTRARTLALSEGRSHIVLFGPGSDICGNPITDDAGNPVALLVIDDGPPGTVNCCINTNEKIEASDPTPSTIVSWGASLATVRAPRDAGTATAWATSGSSFSPPGGGTARGVLFRPDGIPVTYNNACTLGGTGSGGGAIYATNGERDYAVVVSPIGAVSVERFENTANAWED